MGDSERIEVMSDVLRGAFNLLLMLLTYISVAFLTLAYLKYWHGIDFAGLFQNALAISAVPVLSEILEFFEVLIRDIITSTFIIVLVYAAHIANYRVTVEDGKLKYRSGFFFLKQTEFDLEDVEQVYTDNYTFLFKTKELCIKALDEDLIRIPYVRNAEETKDKIISRVKARNHDLEIEYELHTPINVSRGATS